jgi:hypothetical protein
VEADIPAQQLGAISGSEQVQHGQLLDDLVGEREELGRKLDAERLRRLEIDH